MRRRISSSFIFPFPICTFLIQIAICVILLVFIPAGEALSSDGLALLAFKAAVSGDPTSALASWAEEDPDPCHWPGVSCANISSSPDPNRVIAIAVAGKNLSGYIPSELGLLVFLRHLNLHGNSLSGSIPAELFNATSLHSLFLYDNNISGPLPPSICDPPRLQNLDLSRNSLFGTLPPELRGCHQLQRLLLSGNQISGRISAGIWPQLAGLVQLDISSNKFDGPLPSDIGDLDSLAGTLNLSNNRFSGSIPKSLGRLPPMVILDLRYNNFSGEIPQSGSLANQGPNAFLNNPGLCGFPLQIPCSKQANATQQQGSAKTSPDTTLQPPRKKGLRPGLILLISMADAAGVASVGLVLLYIFWKVKDRERKNGCSCTVKSRMGGEGDAKNGWQCLRCWKGGAKPADEDVEESGDEAEIPTASVDVEAADGKLVSLDKGFHFELDELLQASAYVLGKGDLGIVYKVVLGNGVPVAVRRLGEGGGHRYKRFAAEVHAIAKAKHPNVVRLRAFYWAPNEKLLISDFIPNGNLAAALRGRSNQSSLSWRIRLRIAKGAALGLAYLHEWSPTKFVHGNIKPSNILLGNDNNPFISDLGINCLVSIASATASATILPSSDTDSFVGTALPFSIALPRQTIIKPSPYRAPEARFTSARATQKGDVYSFGIVLLELLTGRQPETASLPWGDMQASIASTSCLTTKEKASGQELVRWVRKGFEEVWPLAEMVDPVMLSEVQAKKEVVAAFHVALACTELDPEIRPRMKTVYDRLDRIGH